MIYLINYKVMGERRQKVALPIKDREQLMALRNANDNLEHLTKAREGNKKAKPRLLQLAYNLGYVDEKVAGSHSIGSYFFHDVDIEKEKADPVEICKQILAKKEEIRLVMLERSVSGGWHLVCERERGKTILENQVRVATILKLEMDTSAHDLQRVVFSTSGAPDDLIYLDDALFGEPMSPKECEAEYELLKKRERLGEEEVPQGAKKADKHYRPWEDKEVVVKKSTATESPKISPSLAASEATLPYQEIIAEWWRQNGEPKGTGMRNVKLHSLAVNLRAICDNDPELMARVMPNYGLSEQEMTSIIASATKEQPKGVSTKMRRVLTKLGITTDEEETDEEAAFEEDLPPEMPKKLPKLIELLTSKTPEVYKSAVAHAVFPALGAHLWKVRFPYIDNVCHEATLMNVLMAGTGAGKDCISEPINRIMADIRLRDAENLKREAEWKKEVNAKGANKDKRQRPEGLVIQEVDPDMTNPAFVMRMAEADEHFLYTKMNEIDQFDALRGSARSSQQFQIMCLAFDPGNRYGQTRVGTQSVTEKVTIRFNWNASTTIQKGQRYFRNVLTDGPISRINFCTIPEREIGADMPIYGTYDAAFDEELRPYIDRLLAARGQIDCQQAIRLAKTLKEECAEFSRLSQSRVYENLSFRANVIAYLKACVLYICNDYKWSKEIEDFVRWSLNYDLWCKMQFFGAAIEEANNIGFDKENKQGPRNLLELLPDEFTLDDAKRMRQQQGLSNEGHKCVRMLRNWANRGYVIQNSEFSFLKTKNEYGKRKRK